jgi:hypothetical protein
MSTFICQRTKESTIGWHSSKWIVGNCKFWLLAMLLPIFSDGLKAQQSNNPASVTPRVAYDVNDDCVKCHIHTATPQDFVSDIPGSKWSTEDKHRRSFELLKDNKALVTQILGFDWDEVFQQGKLSAKPEDREKVERVKECLRCHATWPKNDPAWPADRNEPPVALENGVSCQACHGPGEVWSRPHRDPWWRLCTPSAKKRLGMRDVRHPVVRSLLCASCHVGNFEEGKFVTHAMYAAGHPPLPSFEFSTFASQMPVHWRSLREKGQFAGRDATPEGFDFGEERRTNLGLGPNDIKGSYREANFPNVKHDPFVNLESTEGMLVSGLVVMRDYLKLLQTGFDESRATNTPEFALFDCAACHHELRSQPSPGRQIVRAGLPGRPPLQAWPTTLARAGLAESTADQQQQSALLKTFDDMWAKVERAATQKPFGDSAAIHKASEDLVTWLQPRIVAISREPFDQARAERTWTFLTDTQQNAVYDYHAARQTAWALNAIAKDAAKNEPRQLFFPDGKDRLKLTLPAQQTGKVLEDLSASLDVIANYDSIWFQSVLEKLKAPATE